MRRTTAGGVVVTVVAVAAVGGLIAGSRSESPAEVALRTAPPKPSPILVPVERRTLTSDVVTRGTGTFGAPQKLTVASSTLKPTPGILASVAPVGTQLPEGSVAASVSGRPIFVLVGPNPMARDLGPGLVGDDVRQLEESLVRLGFDPGRADGVYDAGTESGVAALYASQGFAPFTATLEQLATVRARASEQAAALVEVYAATDAAGADHAALSTARIEQRSAVVRAATARRSLAQVQAEATAANRLAEAELSLKRNTVDSLREP